MSDTCARRGLSLTFVRDELMCQWPLADIVGARHNHPNPGSLRRHMTATPKFWRDDALEFIEARSINLIGAAILLQLVELDGDWLSVEPSCPGDAAFFDKVLTLHRR